MMKECEHLLPVTNETFDNDFNLFNTQNGFIDLKMVSLKIMRNKTISLKYLTLNLLIKQIVRSGKNSLMIYS